MFPRSSIRILGLFAFVTVIAGAGLLMSGRFIGQIASPYTTPAPANAPQHLCGNGVIDLGEQCDPFNGSLQCPTGTACSTQTCMCASYASSPDTTATDVNGGNAIEESQGPGGGGNGTTNVVSPGTVDPQCSGFECGLGGAEFCAGVGSGLACASDPTHPPLCLQCIGSTNGPVGMTDAGSSGGNIENSPTSFAQSSSPAHGSVFCGNGIVEPGEQCDDGTRNGSATDRCGANCLWGEILPGGVASSQPTSVGESVSSTASTIAPSFTSPLCGDGVVERGEACDHGPLNGTPGDNCSVRCLLVNGQSCTYNTQCQTDLCAGGACMACTRSVQCPHGERCDRALGACVVACTATNPCAAGQTCTSGTCVDVTVAPVCGNGKMESGEECDDGNKADGDGCSSSCLLENGFCGDGIVEKLLGEQCEPATFNKALPYHCTATCRILSDHCGNGTLDPGEECDQGPGNADLPAHCHTDCSLPRCGDAVLDPGEQCDDGNKKNGDGCDRFCRIENAAVPLPAVTSRATGAACASDMECASHLCQNGLCLSCLSNADCRNGFCINGVCPASIQMTSGSHPPYGKTGPEVVIFMAAGGAAGWSWMRRRRRR